MSSFMNISEAVSNQVEILSRSFGAQNRIILVNFLQTNRKTMKRRGWMNMYWDDEDDEDDLQWAKKKWG